MEKGKKKSHLTQKHHGNMYSDKTITSSLANCPEENRPLLFCSSNRQKLGLGES